MIPLRIALAAFGLAASLEAQTLFVANETTAQVMLFDAWDGAVLDPDFLDTTDTSGWGASGHEAVWFGNAIWVAYQGMFGKIARFATDGTYLGDPYLHQTYGGVNGLAVAGGRLFGTASDGCSEYLMEFDATGSMLSQIYIQGYASDIVGFGGNLLGSDQIFDDIIRFDYAGNSLGNFHASDGVTGIDLPHQVSIKPGNGNVLGAGYYMPGGIYEFDATGAQVDFVPLGAGTVGVFGLENGNLLYTNALGAHVWDISSATSTTVLAGESCRFVNASPVGTVGTSYCFSPPNSTGAPAEISAIGTASLAAGEFLLRAAPVPVQQNGLFFYGSQQVQVPFGNGNLCVAGGSTGVARLPIELAATGVLRHQLDYGAPPTAQTQITAGSTWYFQAWFRDPAAGGSFFNLSDALDVLFVP